MLQPRLSPPASLAPRLAASMMPRAAAGHDGEARPASAGRSRAPARSSGGPREARRAEDRHAGPLEVEALEAAQELEEDAHGAFEVGLPRAPPREERLLGAFDVGE